MIKYCRPHLGHDDSIKKLNQHSVSGSFRCTASVERSARKYLLLMNNNFTRQNLIFLPQCIHRLQGIHRWFADCEVAQELFLEDSSPAANLAKYLLFIFYLYL